MDNPDIPRFDQRPDAAQIWPEQAGQQEVTR